MKVYFTILFLVAAGTCSAQGEADTTALKAFSSFFLGEWSGVETGKAGDGAGTRTYEMVLGGQFLFQRNTSRFDPQEGNPDGEIHQDWAFFSFDQIQRQVVLREFHSEGFVNQYVLEVDSTDMGTITFLSQSIENLPPGWRARVTLKITGDNSFSEFFDLARPGEDFVNFLENRWTRGE